MTAYVYMLLCADGSLYTGWTNNLAQRLESHQAGKGAKYTRSRLPVALAYYEEYETESNARKRECAIKKLSRQKKEELLQMPKEEQATE